MKNIFVLLLAFVSLAACAGASDTDRASTAAVGTCPPTIGHGDSGPLTFTASDTNTYDYYVYVPTTYDDCAGEYPLVLNFHGGGQTADGFQQKDFMVELRTRADNVGAVLVWLDSGTPLNWWNDGVNANPANDHVLMVDEFVTFAKSQLSIDDDRVHAVGFSNGAMFTQHLSAELPGVFASVASIAGTSGSFLQNVLVTCGDPYDPACDWGPLETIWSPFPPNYSTTVDILLIRGELDNTVPVTGDGNIPLTYVLPALTNPSSPGDSDYELWQNATGCTTLTTTVYANATRHKCTGGAAEVRHAIVNNMGHFVPTLTNSSYDGPKRVARFLWNHPR